MVAGGSSWEGFLERVCVELAKEEEYPVAGRRAEAKMPHP